MGYVNTPAHMTAALAAQGGDPIWPGNQKLVIRRANIYSTNPANLPTGIPGTDLGWMEAIGPAIQALTAAGTTVYSISESRKTAKAADAREKDANAIAAKAAEAARVTAEQTSAQVKQVTAAQGGQKDNTPIYIGAGIAGVALLIMLLKR